MDATNGSWPHMIRQMTQNNAIGEGRGNIFRQRHLQSCLDYLSKLLDQFSFLFLLIELATHGETQLIRWYVSIPGNSFISFLSRLDVVHVAHGRGQWFLVTIM